MMYRLWVQTISVWAALLIVGCGGNAAVEGLVINEIDADVDFIELYNAGADTLELSGLSVTDGAMDGTPRVDRAVAFPAGATLDPGAMLVVVANRTGAMAGFQTDCLPDGPPQCLHATWGIGKDGDTLFVVDGDGTVIVTEPYPAAAVPDGRSYARVPDGRGPFVSAAPTPGRPNVAAP